MEYVCLYSCIHTTHTQSCIQTHPETYGLRMHTHEEYTEGEGAQEEEEEEIIAVTRAANLSQENLHLSH